MIKIKDSLIEQELIGLKYYRVELISYNPAWKIIYEQERELLASIDVEVNIAIEHIGSTAVPSLVAKPIIDIMIGVEKINTVHKFIKPLMNLDYHYFGECGRENRFFWIKGEKEITTHHLHLVEIGSHYWQKNLLFRDILRHNKRIADEYAQLKTRLASKFTEDREAYKQGKTDFIERQLSKHREAF